MVGPLEMKIIVASEDDLRRIVREEISAQNITVHVKASPYAHEPSARQPRPGFRFVSDGQGSFKEEPDTATFHPISGGPARELKLRMPPQDGGQALEP